MLSEIDVATVLLISGIVVLCITTAITALSLPSFSPQWRRRPRRDVPALTVSTRAVAARPVTKPALALPPAARHRSTVSDRHDSVDDVDTAWVLIERLLEQDPDRLVEVLTQWISDDLPDPDDDPPSQKGARS